MTEVPDTRYANVGEDRVAYQTFGDGPIDLLYVPSFIDPMDTRWDWPNYVRWLDRVASFSRVIMFDRRGAGASDAVANPGLPLWEEWAEDVGAVLAAIRSKRAVIWGTFDAGPTAMLFAATEPERTQALVLAGSFARLYRAEDYPWGVSERQRGDAIRAFEQLWGTEELIAAAFPGMSSDPALGRWFARASRAAYSPREARAYMRALADLDVRNILSSIRVPTLVIHEQSSLWLKEAQARHLVDHIPGARFLSVPTVNPFLDESTFTGLMDSVEEFLTGTRHVSAPDRVLASVLFTDIVGSTEKAAFMGDRRWRILLESHDSVSKAIIADHGGRLIKLTGDGLLATFEGPGRAIRCSWALRHALEPLGIEIRAGLHTGEVEVRDDDIGGIGVHIAARVLERAGPGEVLVSAAVPLLVAGSGMEFEDRGDQELKGVPGTWRLYAVIG